MNNKFDKSISIHKKSRIVYDKKICSETNQMILMRKTINTTTEVIIEKEIIDLDNEYDEYDEDNENNENNEKYKTIINIPSYVIYMSGLFSLINRETYLSYFKKAFDIFYPIKDQKYNHVSKWNMNDYIDGIIDVLINTHSWRKYEGIISGRVLNNKFNEFCKHNLFKETYKLILEDYFLKNKTEKLKFQSIDSSRICNKLCTSYEYSKEGGKKNGMKLLVICDAFGVIIAICVVPGNVHDSKTIEDIFKNMLINTNTEDYSKNNKYKQTLLADTGYYSENNIKIIKSLGYIPIMNKNIGNTKDYKIINRIMHQRENNAERLNKRHIIENYFSWIKKYPKIDRLYEKNIDNYEQMVCLISSFIALSHM
jgi:hypothetical protein